MKLDEVGLIIDYFHGATPEQLELMGVDPTRLPEPSRWRQHYANELAQPVAARRNALCPSPRRSPG